MQLKYAAQFGLLSLGSLSVASAGSSNVWWRVGFCLLAFAFAVVTLAYALNRPELLMKRESGARSILAWPVLWPYFALCHFSFTLYRVVRRQQPAFAEVTPRLWFGRRLSPGELRTEEHRWSAILDLAAEFPKLASRDVHYFSLPLLDGTAPSQLQLQAAVAWIDEHMLSGNVLVHCALGHGRTGCVILAWLLKSGRVETVEDGVFQLSSRRPGFGLSRAQARRASDFGAAHREEQ